MKRTANDAIHFDREYAHEMVVDAVIYLIEFRHNYRARDFIDALAILMECHSRMKRSKSARRTKCQTM